MGGSTLPTACSVVGLGKLGAPLGAVLARAGFGVVGVDLSAAIVEQLSAGQAPHAEPGLQQALDESQGRFRATTSVAEGVSRTDVSFVVVPTPSDTSGGFRNDFVASALESIGDAIRSTRRYHVVAVVSTVMPGAMEAELAPALERGAGRKVGDGLGLCYSPAFIALGTVIRDLTHPDLLLVGESDSRAGDALIDVFGNMCESEPSVRRTSWINAEIAKIAVNTFVTTKISYANMLSEVCEAVPGADVEQVTAAVGDDRRIGHAYLKGATAYGGPCFPRDNLALARAAREVGVDASLAIATDEINRRQTRRLVRTVADRVRPGERVAVLGIAYKPDTAITDASAGLELATELLQAGFQVSCFDPALDSQTKLAETGLKVASTLDEGVSGASVVVVMTPCREFEQLPELIEQSSKRVTVIDCWRVYDQRRGGPEVFHPGTGQVERPGTRSEVRARRLAAAMRDR